MLNDFLFCFFLGMPAIVATVTARDLHSPMARRLMFWGGWIAIVLVALVTVPMLACDGHLMKAHASCVAGLPLAAPFNALAWLNQPAAMIYVLVLFPLGVLVRLLDGAMQNRT